VVRLLLRNNDRCVDGTTASKGFELLLEDRPEADAVGVVDNHGRRVLERLVRAEVTRRDRTLESVRGNRPEEPTVRGGQVGQLDRGRGGGDHDDAVVPGELDRRERAAGELSTHDRVDMILCNQFSCRGEGGGRIGLIVFVVNLNLLAEDSAGRVDLFYSQVRPFRIAGSEEGQSPGQRQEGSNPQWRLSRRTEEPADGRRQDDDDNYDQNCNHDPQGFAPRGRLWGLPQGGCRLLQ